MKLITQRDEIKDAIEIFRYQWGDGTYPADNRARRLNEDYSVPGLINTQSASY